jgi:CPA2 family monovalent cation:H+ antiporter-2
VLFFVSVGMLFDPAVLISQPGPLLATMAVVGVGTPLTALLLLRLLGEGWITAALLAVGLAQIGEFSFLLIGLGIALQLVPDTARDLILGASILLILLNPLLFALLERLRPRLERLDAVRRAVPEAVEPVVEPVGLPVSHLTGHAVLVGCGRVGSLVAEGLLSGGWPLLIIEAGDETVARYRHRPVEFVAGNAADPAVLAAANLPAARLLLVAIPEVFEAGQIVEQARAANPALRIIGRAHFDAAVEHLASHGADTVVMGEREIARAMLEHAQELVPVSGQDGPVR